MVKKARVFGIAGDRSIPCTEDGVVGEGETQQNWGELVNFEAQYLISVRCI